MVIAALVCPKGALGSRERGAAPREHLMVSQSGHDDGPRVGSLLRASRLRCGEEAPDVAQVLHIRLVYITAIEEGRYDDLPGVTYAIGFIRAYAEHLGLDSKEVVRRFKAETSGLDMSTDLKFLSPIPESGIPRGAILFVGMVVAVLAYGGWYVSSTRDHFLTDLIPPLPERLAALLPTDGATDAKAPPPGPDAALAGEAPQGDRVGNRVGDSVVDSAAETAQPIVVTPVAEVAETTDSPPIKETPTPEAAEIIEPPPIEETPVVEAPSVAVPEPEPQAVAEITETPPAMERGEEPATGDPSSAPDALPPIPVAATTNAPEQASVPEQAVPAPPPPAEAEAFADLRQPTPPAAPETVASPAPPVEVESPGPAEDSVATAEAPLPETAGGDGDQIATLTEDAEQRPANDSAPPAEEGESRIMVRARMASWIQVRDDVGNQLLMTRLMRAGDTFRVPDRPGLTLLTGNAGALDILVDGETMPPLGPIGAVRRDVTLDIERLREGTATVE